MGKITKKAYKKAVKGTGGILSAVAKNLKVDRSTLYIFLEKYPELKKLLDEEKEKIVDMAEGTLFQNIKRAQEKSKTELLSSGDGWATKYVLSTIGKKRGYVEKQEVSHEHNLPISIEFVKDEPKKITDTVESEANKLPEGSEGQDS